MWNKNIPKRSATHTPSSHNKLVSCLAGRLLTLCRTQQKCVSAFHLWAAMQAQVRECKASQKAKSCINKIPKSSLAWQHNYQLSPYTAELMHQETGTQREWNKKKWDCMSCLLAAEPGPLCWPGKQSWLEDCFSEVQLSALKQLWSCRCLYAEQSPTMANSQ